MTSRTINKSVRVLAINRGKNLIKPDYRGLRHKRLEQQKCTSTGSKVYEYWQ